MKDSMKSSSVSKAALAKRRQGKILLPEHRPSRVGVESKLSLTNAARSKNHLAWYVALNSKPSEEKISLIPQIKWKCPPKFALSTSWHVAAGEGSQELEAQKYRERTAPEIVYPNLSAIPPSAFTSPHLGGECYDNRRTPIIPIIPIEEVAAKMPFETTATVNTCINPQPPATCSSVSGNLPLSQCNPSGPQGQSVGDKSLPDVLRGLESGDLEVAVAAAATVAAALENKEQINTELLVKFLTDPEMVEKLIDGNGLMAKPETGTPTAPEPNTSFPLPSSTPASVVDKLATECSQPLSRAIPPNSIPEAVNQSLVLPCSKVETEINKPASKQSSTHLGPICTSTPAKNPIPSPRSTSDVPPIKKLTHGPGGPVHLHSHQIAQEKQVRPLVYSTPRPDEETINRLIKKYVAPDIAGIKPVTPLNPCTSKPNVEAIKEMIRAYGAPDAVGIKPVAPLIASTSRPPNMEEITKMRNRYGVTDHGWGKPFMGPSPLMLASTPLPPTTDLHALPNALESNFNATGNFCFPFSSPMTISAPKVDLHYHKSLIKQHGEEDETEEQKLPKFSQPGNYMQGLESTHNTTSIKMNPKYQKPCIYFSTAKGCRNGYNCLYQHDVSKRWRADGAGQAPAVKRMKFSEIGNL